ncbi:hypothetical protein OROMI_002429 [Orobanche minor]
MAAGVPRIDDSCGGCFIPLRAVANFSGHLHSANPLLHYIRRLRLFRAICLLCVRVYRNECASLR